LDGLRGLAVILVTGVHFGVPGFAHGGATGVAMFFALSGFLITSILVEEWRRSRTVDVVWFYTRRARRLLPALITMLVVVGAIAAMSGRLEEFMPSAVVAALYVGNWAFWYHWIEPGPVTHAWTLGVEEQFYLAWPAVIVLAARWKVLAAALAIIVALVLQQGGIAILAGSSLAIALHAGWMRRTPPWLGALALAALLLPSVFGMQRAPGIALMGLMSVPLIGALLEPTWFTRSFAPFRGVGRISYGLYLWHVPMAWLLPVDPLPLLGLTFAAATASWVLIERPGSMLWRCLRLVVSRREPALSSAGEAWPQHLRRPAG
jgi:peptidoglycan/LPS O-acetylase OafA/YrhL